MPMTELSSGEAEEDGRLNGCCCCWYICKAAAMLFRARREWGKLVGPEEEEAEVAKV